MLRWKLPTGLAVDGSGNVFIPDPFNHRVRKISPEGIISTVAGNGVEGFSEDGGLAINASLARPVAVAVDEPGNLYIVEFRNLRVRKVSPAGIISTVAGNGLRGDSGDGGLAIDASFDSPINVAVDSAGNLFIADYNNHRVRRVDSTGVVSTIAGTGDCCFTGDGVPATSATLFFPHGIAFDGEGNLYIADSVNQRIRMVDSEGIISTVAGNGAQGFSGDGGPAIHATLNEPFGVAMDSARNLYIADHYNLRIRAVNPEGIITTIAGNGAGGFFGDGSPGIAATLFSPDAVAVAGGTLYVADTFNHRIRKISPDGSISTVAGNGAAGFSGDGGPCRRRSPVFAQRSGSGL